MPFAVVEPLKTKFTVLSGRLIAFASSCWTWPESLLMPCNYIAQHSGLPAWAESRQMSADLCTMRRLVPPAWEGHVRSREVC